MAGFEGLGGFEGFEGFACGGIRRICLWRDLKDLKDLPMAGFEGFAYGGI